ncbi:LysR family transcriptional regulator, partial [Methyloversatilis discipulorum]
MNSLQDALRIFVAAADAKNFREAATRLGLSPQAVTRAI